MAYRRSTRSNQADVRKFTADDVWAAACAAQRLNGEYLKDQHNVYDEDYKVISSRPANKALMREMLLDKMETVTDADREHAKAVRDYWQCKLMDVLSNRASPFTVSAVELSSREEFAANDWLGLATVACLPHSYTRGLERDARTERKMEAQMMSQHFGKVGDKVRGELEVLESRYSQNWETWYVTAVTNGNVVLFAYRSELVKGEKYSFSGSVKAHREDNVTQLNRVRLS